MESPSSTPTATPSEYTDEVFHALAAEPRRELLLLLARGEASVSELAEDFDISRPAISKHLSVLRDAKLVDARKEGRRNIYHLEHEPLQEAMEWFLELDQFWGQHLDEIGAELEDDV